MNVYLMLFSLMAHALLHMEDTVDLVLCTRHCNFAKERDCELKLDSSN